MDDERVSLSYTAACSAPSFKLEADARWLEKLRRRFASDRFARPKQMILKLVILLNQQAFSTISRSLSSMFQAPYARVAFVATLCLTVFTAPAASQSGAALSASVANISSGERLINREECGNMGYSRFAHGFPPWKFEAAPQLLVD